MCSLIRATATTSKTRDHVVRFDYAVLDVRTAQAVRLSAERIRQRMKDRLADVVHIGAELISVKGALPHGQFGRWLYREFGWKERSARHFMNVAQWLKSATLGDLDLDLRAAYLLAAPSTPDRARTLALRRAENGGRITYATALQILAETKARPKVAHPNRQ